ncbi:alpha-ketoglutarate-dependent dioxygenase AlkB family protein [Psychrobacter sp. TWR1-1-1]|uniref:alpha-ketoglutarate-dependent dioxygenase AlkB family protein n=1 Tax=Psychrobacter sp. TWR1-1-1 TaxID=2804665 RepID=UPI003CEF48AD
MDLFDTDKHILPFKFPDDIAGCSYQWNPRLKGFDILVPNGKLFFAPNFFDEKISNRSVEYFLENNSHYSIESDWKSIPTKEFEQLIFDNIAWQQEYINLYGRKPIPRLTAWYGDEGKSYSYSGINQEPNSWNKGLTYIKEKVEEVAGVHFNSVLLNWYRNGDDYLNWHADDEKELGINPVIGSVNFGATRDFQIRNNTNCDLKLTIPLAHGTLLIMSGELQSFWQHAVPKRKKINKSRFNLTFRVIK